MPKIRTESVLLYDYKQERLFMVCRTDNRNIIVSSSLEEIMDNTETVIRDLILAALIEIGNSQSFMQLESIVEVIDPSTMRFMLDSRIKSQIVIYRKCDHCYEIVMKFISKAVK